MLEAMYGLLLALGGAVLFGASTPASKVLIQFFDPLQLAGLLYLGAAIAMVPVVLRERGRFGRVALSHVNRARLAGVVILGGVVGPILLLVALQLASASAVSLLLNFEIVATAVLGAVLFHEPLNRCAWLGVAGIVGAGALLSGGTGGMGLVAALVVVAACICWGVDNHLSALIDGMTPARSTLWKGAVAGTTNLAVGVAVAPLRAPSAAVVTAITVGAVAYGASIALHTAAGQRVGAVRAQGVFASAPFVGAALSLVFLGEQVTPLQMGATALFLISVARLVARQHEHTHRHDEPDHVHAHMHTDDHHLHEHPEPVMTEHTHWHAHERRVHAHPHWSDLHHRHSEQ
jgi:drug/metabolite transporter (DMT)-like permease